MIEDIIAQSHLLVDTLQFDAGSVALSVLRSISDSLGNSGPFGRLLDIRFGDVTPGHCSATMEVKHHLLNPLGIAHGGATFSFGDTISGCAALTALGEPRIVTQDMQIRYHAAVRPGTLHADANVIHKGQRTVTTQCSIFQNEILVATLTATFAILSDAELELVMRGEQKK